MKLSLFLKVFRMVCKALFLMTAVFFSLAAEEIVLQRPPTCAPQEERGLSLCMPPSGRAPLASNCYPSYGASVSFLFLQTKLFGLEFAGKSFLPNTPGDSNQEFIGKLYVPDFAWRPGVKVQLGGTLPYDGWDLWVSYMYYHEECTSLKKHFSSQTAPPGMGVVPLWNYPFLQIVGGNDGNPLRYGSSAANWRMNFNTLDINVGHFFSPVKGLSMQFKMGAKGAAIHQVYHVDYGNGTTLLAIDPSATTPASFTFNSSTVFVTTHSWGLGPKLGLESKWDVRWGIRLIGNCGLSLLCSFFDLDTKYNASISPPPSRSSVSLKDDFTQLTPVCEAMLGLDWKTCWNSHTFGISLGYEYQFWWSINHVRRNYVQTLPGETFDMNGELQMQGMNAAVKWEY